MLAVLLLLLALAQDPTAKFEVASVKPAVHNDDSVSFLRGGPGTDQPERITGEYRSLTQLLHVAYDLDYDQISGPSWLGTERYTVIAKVPPGTTKEQVRVMWQNLLVERFHLQTHLTKKKFAAYELSVSKNKARFVSEPGFPEPRPGEKWAMRIAPPRNQRWTFQNASIADLTRQLSWPLSNLVRENELALGRIVDKTRLQGAFSFTLEFAGSRGPGGAFPLPLPDNQPDTAPYLIEALRQQLGLILVEKKVTLDVLVVDHANRSPSEN